jgi:hypothetical protein
MLWFFGSVTKIPRQTIGAENLIPFDCGESQASQIRFIAILTASLVT